MTEKPQPLDLGKDTIYEWLMERFFCNNEIEVHNILKEGVDFEDILFIVEKIKQRIKSTVFGLLEEIDMSYGCIHHKEEGGDDECIICVAIGQTLNEVKRKIKKWFPDIFEDEND